MLFLPLPIASAFSLLLGALLSFRNRVLGTPCLFPFP